MMPQSPPSAFCLLAIVLVLASCLSSHSLVASAFSFSIENTWRSSLTKLPADATPAQIIDATRNLCLDTPIRSPDDATAAGEKGESGLVLLFVSPTFAEHFSEVVKTAHRVFEETSTSSAWTVLSVVGRGIIGGGIVEERSREDEPGISILCGILPSTAEVEAFSFGPEDKDEDDWEILARKRDPKSEKKERKDNRKGVPEPTSPYWNLLAGRGDQNQKGDSKNNKNNRGPSYLVFADRPAPVEKILRGLDSSGGIDFAGSPVVAGGFSEDCIDMSDIDPDAERMDFTKPLKFHPTLGISGQVYPFGSAVGVSLRGSVGLQSVASQGCRPVGPAFGVTRAENGVEIIELDNISATFIKEEIEEGLSQYLSEQEKEIVQQAGGQVLGGLADPSSLEMPERGDYLIRELGFCEIVSNPEVRKELGLEGMFGFGGNRTSLFFLDESSNLNLQKGDIFRFHVRDPTTAKDDLQHMVQRVQAARAFVGPEASGVPLAVLQICSHARGTNRREDMKVVQTLLDGQEDACVGGFFTKQEIGAVGISGLMDRQPKKTHRHRFSLVAAIITHFGSDDSAEQDLVKENESDDNIWR